MKPAVKKIIIKTWLLLAGAYLILLIPEKSNFTFEPASSQPFTWSSDDRWFSLESAYLATRAQPPEVTDHMETAVLRKANLALLDLNQDSLISHDDPRLAAWLDLFFDLSPIIATTQHTAPYLQLYNNARQVIKRQSVHWNLNDSAQRTAMYILLYGMRAAVEEVLLQADTVDFNPVQLVTPEASATPSAVLRGITVHSGDLLVSRGGAEVSAFISRGNDYPGNFSHVALLYVDAETSIPYFIEAHIEKGVAIASAEEYLKDRKLRFMVLRPRAELPPLKENPRLPHEAAQSAYEEALSRHIPYDFKMNFHDPSAMFCSEVGSYAYAQHGLQLWQAESTISSRGTAEWLHAFGVENFVTQMPSDLEYDPHLSIVAEWSDPQSLLKDHIDNAVMDVLLEEAGKGMKIQYNPWLLPLARLIKGFSMIQNLLGYPGIIPEGMSATQGLKNNWFVEHYQTVRARTAQIMEEFIREKGYRPPYWQMINAARESVQD